MANIQFFDNNGSGVGGSGTVGLAQAFGAQTSTLFEVLNANGTLHEVVVGTGFTYGSDGFFNGGHITEEYFFDNGNLVASYSNIDINVSTRNSLISAGGSSYDLFQYFLRGDDTFIGSSAGDTFAGSKGNDVIDGGGGEDLLTYFGFSEGVVANLALGTAATSFGTTLVTNVEDLEGSAYADKLTGNAGSNTFQGFGGNDIIDGGAGFDTAIYLDATSAVNVNLATGVVSGGSGADTLISIERIVGSRYNDTLTGSAADETFVGGAGNDTIDGGGGVDTVEYSNVGAGVTVNLTTGQASGGAGNDVISNVENVTGSVFNDLITGNAGANRLLGLGGNDKIIGGAGADYIDGGTGINTASYETATSGVYIAQGDNGHWTGDAAGDVLVNIQNLTGSAFNDILLMDGGANRIDGGAGNDSLYGMGGNDILIGGAGADLLDGGTGTNTASYETATSGVYVAAGDNGHWTGDAAGDVLVNIQNIIGSAFSDILLMDSGANVINGGAGNDSLYGMGGNDTLIGGAGADLLDGGTGNNTASYEAATSGVYVVNGDNGHWTGDAAGDVLVNIQNIIGSAYNDTLMLDNADNIVNGGAGSDSLYGSGGNDILIGGTGADYLDGGTGSNTASYETAGSGVYVVVGDNGHWTGDAQGDTFVNIQNLTGSAYNDILLLDNNANILNGGAGNDTLYGLGGNDTLIGGSGADLLDGGTGTNTASYETATSGVYVFFGDSSHWTGDAAGDQFVNIQNITGSAFNDIVGGDGNANTLTGGAGADTLYGMGGADVFNYNAATEGGDAIMDFNSTQGDKIGINSTAFGISSLTLGTNFFSGSGAAPTSAVASLYFDTATHTLWFDADGTGSGAAVALATLSGVASLTATDFSFHP